jgi:hypothetical protein
MAANSVSVNHYWSKLNLDGRCGIRKHYRQLRNFGMDRSTARMITSDALWGMGMAKYWTADV